MRRAQGQHASAPFVAAASRFLFQNTPGPLLGRSPDGVDPPFWRHLSPPCEPRQHPSATFSQDTDPPTSAQPLSLAGGEGSRGGWGGMEGPPRPRTTPYCLVLPLLPHSGVRVGWPGGGSDGRWRAAPTWRRRGERRGGSAALPTGPSLPPPRGRRGDEGRVAVRVGNRDVGRRQLACRAWKWAGYLGGADSCGAQRGEFLCGGRLGGAGVAFCGQKEGWGGCAPWSSPAPGGAKCVEGRGKVPRFPGLLFPLSHEARRGTGRCFHHGGCADSLIPPHRPVELHPALEGGAAGGEK